MEPVAALETKTSYQVDVTGLFPGGEYKLMVTAWQNKSGEYAVSQPAEVTGTTSKLSWVKVFRIISEFRILRLTFYRKSASKC